MTIRLRAISFLLCWWATGALGQAWVVYTPPEGDFRVLFPAQPARTAEAQGAVAYSVAVENITFTVHRRDPALQPIGNGSQEIRQRLRGGNDDQRVAQVRKEDGDTSGEHVFITRGMATIHKLVVAEGRYYELVVGVPRSELGRTRATARDFFGSFQIGGAPVSAGAPATVAPDVLCKGRSNAFSRAYCEYSTCLKSRYRDQPYCQTLLRFR